MMRKNVSVFPKVEYHKLTPNENDDGFVDSQFECLPRPIPWKSIGLAILLFSGGFCLLLVGSLLVSGYIDAKYADRTWPLIILGAIMFIPGFYHVRIAFYAYKQYPGYSFEDIPEFE